VSTNDVDVIAGDTNQVSQGWGSMASRSVQIGGSAVLRTSRTLWERARQVASEVKEVDAKDLIRSPGGFTVAGVPDAVVTLAEVAQEAIAQGVDLSAEEFYSPGAQTFPYGVHAAVVEVNIETGEIRL